MPPEPSLSSKCRRESIWEEAVLASLGTFRPPAAVKRVMTDFDRVRGRACRRPASHRVSDRLGRGRGGGPRPGVPAEGRPPMAARCGGWSSRGPTPAGSWSTWRSTALVAGRGAAANWSRASGRRDRRRSAGPAVDTRAELLQALGQLPARQRAVLVLRYFNDLTEVAGRRGPRLSAGDGEKQCLTWTRAAARGAAASPPEPGATSHE